MKRILMMGLCCLMAAGLLLSGCTGSAADAERFEHYTQNAALMARCGKIADAVMMDVIKPLAPLSRVFSAVGVVGDADVLVFQALASSNGLDKGGFVAVRADEAGVYFAYGATAKSLKFFTVAFSASAAPSGAYRLLENEPVMVDYLKPVNDAPQGGNTNEGLAGFSYTIADEWLQALKGATMADWARHSAEGDEYWRGQYCDNMLVFLAQSGTVLPAGKTSVEQMETALDGFDAAGQEDTLALRVVCGLYGLDADAYYQLLTYVKDK